VTSARIGLVVNPIAGMGGAVGLKGTDGACLARAVDLGAAPRSVERARTALQALSRRAPSFELLTGPGEMGADAARASGIAARTLGTAASPTGPVDTRRIALALREAGCGLLLVAGGDGTARDVLGAVGTSPPILGIPAGVKMQSAVFAATPAQAGEVAAAWLRGEATLREAEVVDLDEALLRAGRISSRLHGLATVPVARGFRAAAKASPRIDDEAALDGAARELVAGMEPGRVYVLGPGTTTRRVGRALGLETTLLGVDAVLDGRLIGRDLGEAALLALIGARPVSIVVGVSGGQGFVLGRGDQPIGAALIARAGRDGLVILAGPEKLAGLRGAPLLIDTGDPALDRTLTGWVRVRTGPGRLAMMRLEA
jgi:predicted polyphosphate/ATP-dependent NAD kinase